MPQKAAARTEEGRRALVAFRESRALLAFPSAKRAALRSLLARHAGARILVFTSDNATRSGIYVTCWRAGGRSTAVWLRGR